jgi:PAS domain S-box-containing protein
LVVAVGLTGSSAVYGLMVAAPSGALSGVGIWLVASCLAVSIVLLWPLMRWPIARLPAVAFAGTAYYGAYLTALSITSVLDPGSRMSLIVSMIWFIPLQAFNKIMNRGRAARLLGWALVAAPLLVLVLLSPQIIAGFPPALIVVLVVCALGQIGSALMLNTLWRYREAFITEHEASSRFRFAASILEGLSESFVLVDRDFRLLYLSESACAVLGVCRADAEGQPLAELLDRIGAASSVRSLEDAWSGNGPSQFEIEVAGGWYDVRCTPGREDMSVYFRDVTEQRATAESLRKSQALLTMAGRLSRMGGWEYLIATGRAIVYDEVAAIYGVPPGTILSVEESIASYAADSRPRAIEIFTQCLSVGESFDEELKIITATGRHLWVRLIIQPIRGDDGAILGIQGAVQDIDQQKRVLLERDRLLKRLEVTLESITDAFFTLDRKWRFAYLNSAAERLLQRSRADLQGKVIWEEFPTTVGELLYRELHRAVTAERKVSLEDNSLAGGAVLSLTAYPSTEGLAVYFQDITALRETEQALRAGEMRLAEQAEVLDKANDGIIVEDLAGRVLYWNESATRLLGVAAEEAVGRPIHEVLGIDPALPAEATARVMEAGEWRRTVNLPTRDGRELVIDSHLSLVRDEAGRPKSILSINTDITAQVAVEERLRQAERLEAVGQFTGGVAHDFNNLLTVILGNAEIMIDATEIPAEVQELSVMIKRAAERGAALTQRLLAFAQRQALEPRSVDPAALLAETSGLLRRALREDISLVVIDTVGLWNALVDPAQLETALLNLCVNARDAMPGGGRLTIEAENVEFDEAYAGAHGQVNPGQYVTITVTDTGTGIAPELVGRVFDPFVTTKEFGKGTGLGLSMVYGFIKQSHGHVGIYSELGHGTSVKMYLPRASSPAAAITDEPASLEDLRGFETILVVEDDDLLRRNVAHQLGSLGYQVIASANGHEALEVIRAGSHIDLLFTDVIMPGGLNGPDLAVAAREILPALRLLYTSGYTENAIVHDGRLDPGILLLNKPYVRSQLALKVRAALESA